MCIKTGLLGSVAAFFLSVGSASAMPIFLDTTPATTLADGTVVDAVYLERLDAAGNVELFGTAYIDGDGNLFRQEFATGETILVDTGVSRILDGDGVIVAQTPENEVYNFDGTQVDLSFAPDFAAIGSNRQGDIVGVNGAIISSFLPSGGTELEFFQAGGSDIFGLLGDIDDQGNAVGRNGALESFTLNINTGEASGGPGVSVSTLFNSDGLFGFADDGSVFASDGSLTGSLGAGVFGQGAVPGEGIYAISGNDALFFDLGLELVAQATLDGPIFDIREGASPDLFTALFQGSLQETSFMFDFASLTDPGSGDPGNGGSSSGGSTSSGGGTSSSGGGSVPVPSPLLLLLGALVGLPLVRRSASKA